jgi:ParB-like chromosome segregation protein Spo0J
MTGQPTSVTIEGLVFHRPYPDRVPRPSQEEQSDLLASRSDAGIQEPTVVWERDGDATVVNGHPRLPAAGELGIPLAKIPLSPVDNASEEDARLAAVLTNAVRRGFPPERRRATVAKPFGLKWSLRQVARAVGESHTRVRRDLPQLGLTGHGPAPEKADSNPEDAVRNDRSGHRGGGRQRSGRGRDDDRPGRTYGRRPVARPAQRTPGQIRPAAVTA